MTSDEGRVHRRRGWWIKTAREAKGLTLAALAEALGYSDGQGTISLWEKGSRPVPSGKFPQIAALLDLPDAYLVNPPLTDSERLEAAQRGASELETLESERAEAPGPEGGGGLTAELGIP